MIPEALAGKEIAHPGLTRLHLVKSMHERKALMAELADAFVALPGGYGTLDELFVDGVVEAGFIRPTYRGLFQVAPTVGRLLAALVRHVAPPPITFGLRPEQR